MIYPVFATWANQNWARCSLVHVSGFSVVTPLEHRTDALAKSLRKWKFKFSCPSGIHSSTQINSWVPEIYVISGLRGIRLQTWSGKDKSDTVSLRPQGQFSFLSAEEIRTPVFSYLKWCRGLTSDLVMWAPWKCWGLWHELCLLPDPVECLCCHLSKTVSLNLPLNARASRAGALLYILLSCFPITKSTSRIMMFLVYSLHKVFSLLCPTLRYQGITDFWRTHMKAE